MGTAQTATGGGRRPSGAAAPDAAARELLSLLPALVAALRDSGPHAVARERLPGARLTSRQMSALIRLQEGGEQNMSEFAAGMGVSRATATEMIERLEERGLAVRTHDEADRRVINVRLSDAAAAQAQAVVGRRRDEIAAALRRFPDTPPAAYVAFVRALIEELTREDPQ